jgi:hypothetical protein
MTPTASERSDAFRKIDGRLRGGAAASARALAAHRGGPASADLESHLEHKPGQESLPILGPLKLDIARISLLLLQEAGGPGYRARFQTIALSFPGVRFASGREANASLFGNPEPTAAKTDLGWYAAHRNHPCPSTHFQHGAAMRPVTKVAPTTIAPNYPFYNNNPGAFTVQNQRFKAGSDPARAYNNNNTTFKSVAEIQQDILSWFPLGISPFPAGVQFGIQALAISKMRKRLEKLYRQANVHLMEQLGDYCSYCEIYVPGHLHVEHSIPKSEFPLRTLAWENFLRACPPCNSSKGQRPSHATALGWVPFPILNPTETDIMDAAKDHYFWPDGTADSYRRLSYRLCDVALGYAPIPLALTHRLHSFVNYQVRTNLPIPNPLGVQVQTRHVEVTVVPAGNLAGQHPRTLAQLQNVGLHVGGSLRAGYRTLTCFRVLAALRTIFVVLGVIPPLLRAVVWPLVFPLLWRGFLEVCQTFGHYSTILTILAARPDPGFAPGGYLNLGQRFVHDSNPANPNADRAVVFLGTNTNQLP